MSNNIAVIGGGNIGRAIVEGLLKNNAPYTITVTRRKLHLIEDLQQRGVLLNSSNNDAVSKARYIVLAITPQQLASVLQEISASIDSENHVIVSIVSGISCNAIREMIGKPVSVVRAMPNTAIAIGESMTCLATDNKIKQEILREVQTLFDYAGKTLVIEEDLMEAATALCACGLAFFLRTVRAASQGGIEIGFHAEEAILMAAQTAKGAASLLLESGNHPEDEIDKVTTPRGITITGLNEMEHRGFSSAFIKGITTSANKAKQLFSKS